MYKIAFALVNLRRKHKIYNALPGPKDYHWFYGNLHLFMSKKSHERIQFFLDCGAKYRRYYRLWFGFFRPIVFLNHPDTIKVLMKTAEPKPKGMNGGYRFLKQWLGEGLLVSDGARWSRSRRLLTPAFHFDILRPYVNVNNECAELMLNQISKYADSGKPFELYKVVSACTLDIILKCAFSYETDCQKDGESHPYITAVRDIAHGVAERSRKFWLHPDIIYYLTPTGRKFKRLCDYVHGVAEDVIEKRQKVLDKEGAPQRKYLDFLDILLTAKDENGIGLSKLEIRNEVDTFLFEGHDTTASGISWILYSLAEHPEYQEKVQAEIDDVLEGRDTEFIQWDDLSKFEYLTMCIKEGMRLHSPVPGVARESTREITIDGQTFPKGTMFSLSLHQLHKNPDVWENANEYDPERFSKENVTKMDTYAFCPFSAGPRNCIGQHFAMNEEKVVLARFLHRYSIELAPNHTVHKEMAAVTRAKNGIQVIIKRRK